MRSWFNVSGIFDGKRDEKCAEKFVSMHYFLCMLFLFKVTADYSS